MHTLFLIKCHVWFCSTRTQCIIKRSLQIFRGERYHKGYFYIENQVSIPLFNHKYRVSHSNANEIFFFFNFNANECIVINFSSFASFYNFYKKYCKCILMRLAIPKVLLNCHHTKIFVQPAVKETIMSMTIDLLYHNI